MIIHLYSNLMSYSFFVRAFVKFPFFRSFIKSTLFSSIVGIVSNRIIIVFWWLSYRLPKLHSMRSFPAWAQKFYDIVHFGVARTEFIRNFFYTHIPVFFLSRCKWTGWFDATEKRNRKKYTTHKFPFPVFEFRFSHWIFYAFKWTTFF